MAQEQVLIIGASAHERLRLRELLEVAEFRVAEAADDREGYEIAKRLAPAVILAGRVGPSDNDWRAIRRLKSDPITCAIPIVILSDTLDSHDLSVCDAAGIVMPPIDPARLLTAVRRAVWLWRTHQLPRVLIADDEPDTVDILSTVFRHEGFVTLEACNGAQALELTRRERPDIVILDVAMPGVDGWEALRTLKRDAQLRNIPVVMLTGIAISPQDEEAALALGAARYLTKPFVPATIVTEVAHTLHTP